MNFKIRCEERTISEGSSRFSMLDDKKCGFKEGNADTNFKLKRFKRDRNSGED